MHRSSHRAPCRSRSWRWGLIAVLLLGLLGASGAGTDVSAQEVGTPAGTPDGTPAAPDGQGDTDPELYAGVVPASRDAIYGQTAGDLSRYAIDLTITPAAGDELTAFSGTVDLLFVNPTARPLDEAVFRLYPNDERYGDGDIAMRDVVVAGEAVEPELSVGDTVATIPLGTELAPGEAITVTYAFDGAVANDPAGSYGMFTYSPGSGTLALAHWYPMLAGIEVDEDWKVEPVSVNGDPVFSNTSLYDVTISLPAEWQVAASGLEVESDASGDLLARRFVTGPSRDFTFVADTSFERISERVGETEVVAWYDEGSRDGAEAVLAAGVATLEQYQPLLGEYPFAEMDLVEVSVGNGAAGIEFPQLMFIGGAYYDEGPVSPPDTSYLESLVVHEVLHQWFYGLVGNDQYAHGFQDEAITNYLMAYYFGLQYDGESFEVCYLSQVEIPYLRYLFANGDMVVDFPSDEYAPAAEYVIAAYYKGAVGFGAINEAIGDDAFFAGLRVYVADFRFSVAAPADMLAAFETAAGRDLDDLWANWFEAENGTADFSPADLQAAESRLAELLAAG